jgi:hypothetical protein
MGAAVRSGADMQQFASGLQPGAGDPIGSAMGAALRAGADMQQFASSLPPPPAPEPVATPTTGAPSRTGAVSGVGSVPGWLSDLISSNAPPELANDPDFIRTVAAGAKAESGWDPNAVQKGGGGRGLFQFDLGGMGKPYAGNEQVLLGESGAQLQASQIVPLYAKAYASAPAGLSGADKASWVAAQAERPAGYTDPASAARRNYASAYGEIGGGGGAPAQELLSRTGAWAEPVKQAKQISQFGDSQLSNDEAYAACGPAAAVRFAQMFGRNPTLREATDLAGTVGWTSGSGMAGLGSEKALMDKMGVATKAIGADVQAMAREAQTGNPVTISTPGHYFFADGYDPQSGAFHVGQSGLDLKGGSEWMTADQMQARMGQIQGALLADNPQVPTTSSAEVSPLDRLGRAKDQAVRRITGEADDLTAAVSAVGNRPPEFSSLDVDTSGRISPTTLGTSTYKSTMLPGDQDVSTPDSVVGAPQQGPVDRLKSAFGDFVDSLGGVPSYNQARQSVGQAVSGARAAPEDISLISGLPEPIAQGISAVGAAGAQTLGGLISQPSGLDATDTIAELTTKYPTSGKLQGIVPNLDAMTPEDRNRYSQAMMLIGSMSMPGGSPEGRAPLSSAELVNAIKQYPEDVQGSLREFVRSQTEAGASGQDINNTLRSWVAENPVSQPEALSSAETQGESPIEVSRVTRAPRGGGGEGPAGAQPGQIPLEDFGRGERPIEAPRPPIGAARAPSGGGGVGPAGAQVGQMPLEDFGRGQAPVRGPIRPAQEPTGGGGPGFAGAQEGQAPLGGTFEQPELKLPTYLPKGVQDLVQTAHQNVFDRSSPLDAIIQRVADRADSTTERVQKAWKDSPDAVRAIDEAMSQSGDRLGRLQEALKADPTNTAARNDVVQELARYQALQETTGKQLPKAGSLLDELKPGTIAGQKAILEQVQSMADRAKMTPDEWAENLAKVDLSDPERVANFANITRKYTFGDKLQAIWYFNLLSSPLTHIRNIVSNTAVAATAPGEALGSAAFDPLARRLLGDTGPRQRYAGESLAQVQGMLHSLPSVGADGLRAGAALESAGQAMKYGTPGTGGEITRLAKEPFAGTLLEPIGYTGRALEAEDQFFRSVNHGAALHGEAYRLAKQEGKTGQAFNDRVSELISRPDEQMLENAKKSGAYRTFQQEDAFASALNQAADKSHGLLNVVMPFRRTPINVAKYVLERSPAGALKIGADFATPGGRQALREAGSGELADRMSRTAIGSTIMAGAVKFGLDGNLTGRAPDDATERDQWQRTGKTPYSFKNPLNGEWVSYQAIQPYSTLIGAAADVADAYKRGQIKDPSDVGALATVTGMALGRGLADQPWTQGLTEMLDLMEHGSPDPGKVATRLASQYAGNAVLGSGLLRTVARMTDNVVRDPADYGKEGVLERIATNLPIASQNLPAKRDAFGFETTRPSAGLEAGLSPFPRSADTSDDPVEKELARLAKNPDYNAEPTFVDKNISIGNQRLKLPVELDENQRRKYQEQSGQLSYALLAQEVETEAWKKMPDKQKVAHIRDIYSKSREVTRALMTPELLGQGVAGFQEQVRRGEAVRATPTPSPDTSTEEEDALAAAG